MINSNTTQKIEYISFLQSFAVVLVVLGHCMPEPNMGDKIPICLQIIHDTIYTFHMPLFFVLAGFLLMNSIFRQSKNIQNFYVFVNYKFRRLIIPYFTMGTLAYLLKGFVFDKFAYKPIQLGLISYIKSLLIPWNNVNTQLWFLPTIFLIFMLSYLIILFKNNYKNNLFILLTLAFIVSFLSHFFHISLLNISGVLYYMFYFFIGIVIFNIKEMLFKYLSNTGIVIFIVTLFIELQFIPEFRYNSINYIISYISAILGILISFSLATYYCNHNKKFLWGLIDGQYYQVYLLSYFFQSGMRVFYQMSIINYTTVVFFMFIASFIFPILITNIIKRFFPMLKVFIGL